MDRRSLRFGVPLVLLPLAGCMQDPPSLESTGQAESILGTAQSFAVLAGSTVTNTGPSVVTGNLGVSPGSAVTGFPPGTVSGTIHVTDAVALQAQSDTTTSYNTLAGEACNSNLTGTDLAGLTLTPGVYCFSSSAQLSGALVLNAMGDANAQFIFQIGSTLTTASNASVTLINGGQDCGVYWQVGSSATIGTTTTFVGNILALTSITLNTGANVTGSVLARNGAVTLDTNQIAPGSCTVTSDAGTADTGTPDTGTVDAGTTDTGSPDSGAIDSGTIDSGVHDAGAVDGGAIDSGVHDAGTIDSGVHDAGAIDSGVHDAGAVDGGAIDSGVHDAGAVDSGVHDAGAVDAGVKDGGCSACCAGTVDCGGTCVDVTSDSNNCGACGHTCTASETCGSSACVPCVSVCEGTCSNPMNDAWNCGACGNACASNATCMDGVCEVCTVLCRGYCADLKTSASDCGACGHVCATGDSCVDRVCVAPCPPVASVPIVSLNP